MNGTGTPSILQLSQGQPRASLRPKARQPQGPPDKDARGFTMGRGRAVQTTPAAGLSAAMPSAPGSANGMTSSFVKSTSPVNTMSTGHQAALTAAPDLGQKLLAQLQGQASARGGPGVDLGRGLLQQLQLGSAPPSAVAQRATAQASIPHTDAGRALLAQLQRLPTQPPPPSGLVAEPLAQPMALPAAQSQQDFDGSSAAVSFEQLLRGAAAGQQPRAEPSAQPSSQLMPQPQQPAVETAEVTTFGQLLRAAASNQRLPAQGPLAAPPPGFGFPQQPSQTPVPPPAIERDPPPGFGFRQQFSQPSVLTPAAVAAAASTGADSGRLLLQQLQQGRTQAPALGLFQQPPAAGWPGTAPHTGSAAQAGEEVGKLFLQLLQQRPSDSDFSGGPATGSVGAAAGGPIGAILGAPQPVPSAPPAPTSVLLQSAADLSTASGIIQAAHGLPGITSALRLAAFYTYYSCCNL